MCIICTESIKLNMNIQEAVAAGLELIRSGAIDEDHLEEIISKLEEEIGLKKKRELDNA